MADELKEVLSAYGYKGKVPTIPPGNKKIEKFIKSLVAELKSCETLTGEAKERFEELRRLSKELPKEDFKKVLERKQAEQLKTAEVDELRVAELKEETQSLREKFNTLSHIHKQLTAQHERCLEEKDHVTDHVTSLQQEYEQALHESQDLNQKVKDSLQALQSAITDLCDRHSNQGAESGGGSPLSSVSLDSYHEAEERFTKCLSAYAKKQFLPGMEKMADSSDTTHYGLMDESQLSQHLSELEYQKQAEQLDRLRTILPKVKRELIASQATNGYYDAACTRLETILEEIKSGQGVVAMDTDALKEHIEHRQRQVSELKANIQSIDATLPQLIHDWTSLKTSHILHGNYDLKLERQKYYLSKKNEIIAQLKGQRSRQEVISMLLDAEHRYHKDTHKLLEATSSQLEKWKIETTKRQEQLNDIIINSEQGDNQSDSFTNCIGQLLDISPAPNASHVTRDEVHHKLDQLMQERKESEVEEQVKEDKLSHQIQEMKDRLSELEECVFGKETEKREVQFISEEYKVSVDKLQQMLTTLELEIKNILKEHNEKRKVLQTSPFLQQERNLFVYFFTDTQKLSSAMADLSHRVNTLATAVGLRENPSNSNT